MTIKPLNSSGISEIRTSSNGKEGAKAPSFVSNEKVIFNLLIWFVGIITMVAGVFLWDGLWMAVGFNIYVSGHCYAHQRLFNGYWQGYWAVTLLGFLAGIIFTTIMYRLGFA